MGRRSSCPVTGRRETFHEHDTSRHEPDMAISLSPFPDRIHFSVAFQITPEPIMEVWKCLASYLLKHDAMPRRFKVSQIAGHAERLHSTVQLDLSPEEIELLIVERQLTGFRVDSGHSAS